MKTKRERLRNASVAAVGILAFSSMSFAEVTIAGGIADTYQAEYKKLKPEVELLESKGGRRSICFDPNWNRV